MIQILLVYHFLISQQQDYRYQQECFLRCHILGGSCNSNEETCYLHLQIYRRHFAAEVRRVY